MVKLMKETSWVYRQLSDMKDEISNSTESHVIWHLVICFYINSFWQNMSWNKNLKSGLRQIYPTRLQNALYRQTKPTVTSNPRTKQLSKPWWIEHFHFHFLLIRYDMSVLVAGPISHALRMSLVLQLYVVGQLEHPLQGVSDPDGYIFNIFWDLGSC